MSINVLVPTIVLFSVAYVQPTAEVSYVEPDAQVSYVEPSFQAQWVDIQIFAEATMPDVLAFEIITPTDSISLQAYKNFAESLGVSTDFATLGMYKELSETLTLSEVIAKITSYQRTFTETLNTSSSGSLISQGYCDITYFLEDYVGTSRSFT